VGRNRSLGPRALTLAVPASIALPCSRSSTSLICLACREPNLESGYTCAPMALVAASAASLIAVALR
jgi:hypothetical protein